MANKRGPKMKGETPITYKNYQMLAFMKESEVANLLVQLRVEDRTKMLEKWYQAYKKEQG